MKVKSNDKQEEIKLNEWLTDERTGDKLMYTRLQDVPFCKKHSFNKAHECMKCPFVFTGFNARLHIQTQDGIYQRKPDNQLGKKLD